MIIPLPAPVEFMRAIALLILLLTMGCRPVADMPQGQGDRGTQQFAALIYLWFGFYLDTGKSIGGLRSSHWNTDPGIGSWAVLLTNPVTASTPLTTPP